MSVLDRAEHDLNTGCALWTGAISSNGYGWLQRGGKHITAHRVAYCEANNVTPDELGPAKVVRHKCDTRLCVNPAHLEIGSSVDNTRDRHERGRDAKGELNGLAKLTAAQVIEIRRRYKGHSRTDGSRAMAREYGVSQSLIDQLVARTIWKHVQ